MKRGPPFTVRCGGAATRECSLSLSLSSHPRAAGSPSLATLDGGEYQKERERGQVSWETWQRRERERGRASPRSFLRHREREWERRGSRATSQRVPWKFLESQRATNQLTLLATASIYQLFVQTHAFGSSCCCIVVATARELQFFGGCGARWQWWDGRIRGGIPRIPRHYQISNDTLTCAVRTKAILLTTVCAAGGYFNRLQRQWR